MNKARLEQDELVLISSGEYVDYEVRGIFQATIGFNPDVVFQQFVTKFPEKIKPFSSERVFLEHLVELGLIKEINIPEWYLGDYGFKGMKWIAGEPND